MIISASRRTDIPAYFSDWFLHRVNEKYVYVRNPINTRQVSHIDLSPDIVDCIVFWSKNPKPLLPKLHTLRDYMYYFQFTLNPYGKDIEKQLPSLEDRLHTFIELANKIGKKRVIWRYDPILLTEKYTISWHIQQFEKMAKLLKNSTEKCIFSYIDTYAKNKNALKSLGVSELSLSEKNTLAKAFSNIAHSCDFSLDTCAEDIDLALYHIGHARCMNDVLISQLIHCPLDAKKDPTQRPFCRCIQSIDIGLYNTCQNQCLYCYANHSPQLLKKNIAAYQPHLPLLCSNITELDKISDRKVKSLKNLQGDIFSL